jgi:internalin A
MLDIILTGSEHFSNADLDRMACMTGMELFWIQGMPQVTDISAVSNFGKIYKLNVEDTNVSDISAMSGLTSLVEVSLRGSPVSDISPLKDLVNLKTLCLEGCPVTDYSPVQDLYPNWRTRISCWNNETVLS